MLKYKLGKKFIEYPQCMMVTHEAVMYQRTRSSAQYGIGQFFPQRAVVLRATVSHKIFTLADTTITCINLFFLQGDRFSATADIVSATSTKARGGGKDLFIYIGLMPDFCCRSRYSEAESLRRRTCRLLGSPSAPTLFRPKNATVAHFLGSFQPSLNAAACLRVLALSEGLPEVMALASAIPGLVDGLTKGSDVMKSVCGGIV